jgi:predicted ABC-class ATPase
VLGEWAAEILCTTLPALVHDSLFYAALPAHELQAHLDAVEDQASLRSQLSGLGTVLVFS